MSELETNHVSGTATGTIDVFANANSLGSGPVPASESAAVIRQSSIDELFGDINSAISRVNRSDNWLNSDKYTVDDMFLNSVAEPVASDITPFEGTPPETTVIEAHSSAPAAAAPAVEAAIQSLLGSPYDDASPVDQKVPSAGLSVAAPPVNVWNNTPFHLQQTLKQSPLSRPASLRGGRTPADSRITANSGYDLDELCDYMQAILWSAPMQELHVTILGTIFHRGCDAVVGEKLVRKNLLQQALEMCLQTNKCHKRGEGVDFVIALGDGKKKDKPEREPTYTFLEKIIVWILKDELTNSHRGDTTDGSDFVNMKTLQNAVRSKKTEEGLFKFSLNLSYEGGRIFSVPEGFLTDIPLENSSYSSLFNQAITNLQRVGIVQCLDDQLNRFVRLGEKARNACSPPQSCRSNAAARGSTKSQHGGAHSSSKHSGPSATPHVHSSPYTTRSSSKHYTSGNTHTNQGSTSSRNDSSSDLSLVPPGHGSADEGIPPQPPHQPLEKALRIVEDDSNTIVYVPSVLKMTAILDAMTSGYMQRIEYENGCTVRDITETKDGNEDQRILIRGPPVGRAHVVEKLKKIMNTSIGVSNTLNSAPLLQDAPIRKRPSDQEYEDGEIEEEDDSQRPIIIDKWDCLWGDTFSERRIDQPVYIYYDWSNCIIPHADIAKAARLASQGRAPIKRRVVAGSCGNAEEKQDLERHWALYNEFEAHFLLQPGKRGETYIDDLLHSFITQDVACEAIQRSQRIAFGDHDDVRPVLVLFSNDTNDNAAGVIGSSFPRCLQFALDNGWSIEVWVNCPPQGLSHYHKWKRSIFGKRYKVFFLPEFVGRHGVGSYGSSSHNTRVPIKPFDPSVDL